MKITALALSCVLVVPGLAFAQKVTVEFDESADFSRFKTFRIGEGQINTRAPALNSELTRKRIENEIRKGLVERGLMEVPGVPDLGVFFRLGAARRTEVETYPAGWRGLGTRAVRTEHTEGTLVIDLRDASKRELVWRAVAVEEKNEPAKIAERLDEMVKKSLQRYPPKKK
jgi:hypothetical protein